MAFSMSALPPLFRSPLSGNTRSSACIHHPDNASATVRKHSFGLLGSREDSPFSLASGEGSFRLADPVRSPGIGPNMALRQRYGYGQGERFCLGRGTWDGGWFRGGGWKESTQDVRVECEQDFLLECSYFSILMDKCVSDCKHGCAMHSISGEGI